ncbi:hypothetical protein GGR50DRAFT_635359 [Xylaria sp. CBS 124048]|nr:hypothetical protein GGR50DRAFT_635359 [Xylaria sp. CBS 124048]
MHFQQAAPKALLALSNNLSNPPPLLPPKESGKWAGFPLLALFLVLLFLPLSQFMAESSGCLRPVMATGITVILTSITILASPFAIGCTYSLPPHECG